MPSKAALIKEARTPSRSDEPPNPPRFDLPAVRRGLFCLPRDAGRSDKGKRSPRALNRLRVFLGTVRFFPFAATVRKKEPPQKENPEGPDVVRMGASGLARRLRGSFKDRGVCLALHYSFYCAGPVRGDFGENFGCRNQSLAALAKIKSRLAQGRLRHAQYDPGADGRRRPAYW